MACSIIFAVFFSYVPFFQATFLTRGVEVQYWFLPMAFGVGLVVIDEVRKLLVRSYPSSFLARIAW